MKKSLLVSALVLSTISAFAENIMNQNETDGRSRANTEIVSMTSTPRSESPRCQVRGLYTEETILTSGARRIDVRKPLAHGRFDNSGVAAAVRALESRGYVVVSGGKAPIHAEVKYTYNLQFGRTVDNLSSLAIKMSDGGSSAVYRGASMVDSGRSRGGGLRWDGYLMLGAGLSPIVYEKSTSIPRLLTIEEQIISAVSGIPACEM